MDTDIQITAEELKDHMSERGMLEWELATLRATNRKLEDMVRALRGEGGNNGHRPERMDSVSEQGSARS